MKWIKFDYNNFIIKNDVEYFVVVHNIGDNRRYYHHIQGRNNTFYMTNSDADYKFNWDYNEHRILYVMELHPAKDFQQIFRKSKISKLFKV